MYSFIKIFPIVESNLIRCRGGDIVLRAASTRQRIAPDNITFHTAFSKYPPTKALLSITLSKETKEMDFTRKKPEILILFRNREQISSREAQNFNFLALG